MEQNIIKIVNMFIEKEIYKLKKKLPFNFFKFLEGKCSHLSFLKYFGFLLLINIFIFNFTN